MKTLLIFLLGSGFLLAETVTEEKRDDITRRHSEGSIKLAEDQDELAADVIEMIEQQTAANIIDLLSEVEDIMGENIEQLDSKNTGGDTIAAQTEIIEKIFQAAQKKQENRQKEQEEQDQKQQKDQQGGQDQDQNQGKPGGKQPGSSPSSGMLEMMRRMMGEDAPGQKPGKQEGKKDGESGGEGQTGDSDSKNDKTDGPVEGKREPRTVPRSTGTTPEALPREFHKALDAYNRGLRNLPAQ